MSDDLGVILVVGASSGIGESIACYLAETGNQVVCVARREDRLKELCARHSEKMSYILYDLNDLQHIEDIVQQAVELKGKLTGMVYSAGINRDAPIRVYSQDVMHEVMRINCEAFVELGRLFSMKKYSEDGGAIVAISAIASLICAKGMCTYSMSKAALNAAVKTMSKEFTRRRIRVNAILPHFVRTEMAKEAEAYVGEIGENILPFGIIEPEYIAYLAEFLLSDKAKYMTGALIPVSGGAEV